MSKAVAKTGEPQGYALVVRDAEKFAVAMSEALAPGESMDLSDLPVIKIPGAGGKNFDLPDGSASNVVTGVVLLRQPVRAFWRQSFEETGGGTPPDCHSDDMVAGMGINNRDTGLDAIHECATCLMAQFGSAVDRDGNAAPGQACTQITRLFMLREGSQLPVVVSLPPTSYRRAKTYAVGLAGEGMSSWHVVTEVGLEQTSSQGGITYSRATLRTERTLSDEEIEAIRPYRDNFMKAIEAVPIEYDV